MRTTPEGLRPSLVALCLVLLTLVPAAAWSAVVLNELLPNPDGIDDNNESIEIYNSGPDTVNVTGWAIEDAATINDGTIRRRIPEDFDPSFGTSAVLLPGSFRVVRGVGVAYLNNTGDTVYLNFNRTGNLAAVVHATSYGSAPSGQCWANSPDGAEPANFAWRACTLGMSNCAADAVPPAAITSLMALAGEFVGEVDLRWNAVGNDGMVGQALQYLVKYNSVPITLGNFAASFDAFNEPMPALSGAPESLTVFGLAAGTWFFAVRALDCQNTAGLSNVPSAPAGTTALPFVDRTVGLQPFYGNLHSHSTFSDGADTPAVAYYFARNLAPTPLDFMALTDHNHSGAGPMTPALYQQGLAAAAAANQDGAFVALYGQEWGLSTGGHVNIFESPVLFGWQAGNFDVFVAQDDYIGLYTAVVNNPGASGALASFCHPVAGDFEDLTFTANGGLTMVGMALVNGPAFSTVTDESDAGNTNFDPQYQEALRKGFFVSPFGDQDNHNANWGASTQSRTAVLLESLTKSNVLAGLAARRTYATQDHNAVVAMKVNGWPMGSRFDVEPGTGVNFDVTTTDVDGDGVLLYELYRGIPGTASPVRIAAAEGVAHFVHRDEESPSPAEGQRRLYYVRVTQTDNHFIWTAPVEVTFATNSDVVLDGGVPARRVRLYPASPNPFNPRTQLEFELEGPRSRQVTLQVFDVRGRVIRTLLAAALGPGTYRAQWNGARDDGRPVSSGVYFARLRAEGMSDIQSLVLVR